MWIFWALFSAVLAASRRPLEKRAMKILHHYAYGFIVQLIGAPILLAIVLICGKMLNPFTLGLHFWAPALVTPLLYQPIYAYLYKRALVHGELSQVLPIQSVWPGLALVIAWVTLGETPSWLAVLGIVITIFGIYSLGLKGRALHHPLQPFRENVSSRAMLGITLLGSIVSVMDKIATQHSNPLFYSFFSTTVAALILFGGMKISKEKLYVAAIPKIRISIIALLQSSTFVTYLIATSMGPIAYVSSLRGSNILMGSLLGFALFKEKITKPKIIAYSLIVIGSAFIALHA